MALDPEQPLYIIELGTGAGKFSFFTPRIATVRTARVDARRRCDDDHGTDGAV